MNDNDTPDNIFRIISNDTPTPPATEPELPSHEYVIVDNDGTEHYANGFLLFTSHHVAVMRDTGKGAMPILMLPINQVRVAEIVEDDEEA